MNLRKLYQASENRENADLLEKEGPIYCKNGSWLGCSYYFWDSYIDNAHWWGKIHYNNKYFIAESGYDADSDELFDLVGNTENLTKLKSAAEIIRIHIAREKSLTVDLVLEYLKEKTSFPYKAVRAYPERSKTSMTQNVLFFRNQHSYIDMIPPIQLCVYDKSFLRVAYKVVFPIEYASDYAV